VTTPSVKVTYDEHATGLVFKVSNTFYSLTPENEGKLFTKHCRFPLSSQMHPGGLGLGLYHAMAVTKKIRGASLDFQQTVKV
jgi:hypothetical protein